MSTYTISLRAFDFGDQLYEGLSRKLKNATNELLASEISDDFVKVAALLNDYVTENQFFNIEVDLESKEVRLVPSQTTKEIRCLETK